MDSPSTLLARSGALLAAGRWREATPLVQQVLALPDCPPGAVLQMAEIDLLAGNPQGAMARIAAASLAPTADSELLLARAEAASGKAAAALQRLVELRRSLAEPSALLLTALANLYTATADDVSAVAALREAVVREPANKTAQYGLATALARLGDYAAAEQAITEALAIIPSSPRLWELAAQLHARAGDTVRAEQAFRRATELQPRGATAWLGYGHFLAECWRFAEAEQALLVAAQLAPGEPATEATLAFTQLEQGKVDAALAAYGRGLSRTPHHLGCLVGQALALPQVYADAQELAAWRARYAAGLEQLHEHLRGGRLQAADVLHLERTNFLLAYQGEDDLQLQRSYAALLAALADEALPQFRAARCATFNGTRRLRIGFLGSHMRTCTAGLYFERWITGLDAARFERFVYHTGPVSDALTARVADSVDSFISIRASTQETAARVLADDLDLLVYPEVGMDSLTYLLANLRLAPVQAAAWGHPVTTGSTAIDFYLTCAAMEPPDAEQHYAEQLVHLGGIGVDYAEPAVDRAASAAQFGLPAGRPLYFCPQSLFKIHPDMDALLAAILRRDKDGVLVMFQAGSPQVTQRFAQRLQHSLEAAGVEPRGQLKFLPRMDTPQFRSALSLADVVLDTVRWSGGNTSLDAFACGVPVVTLPGTLMRGRQAMAMLQMMHLDELVAKTASDYVDIATRVAGDTHYRARLGEQVASQRTVLFNDRGAITSLEEALWRMAMSRL